MRRIKWVFNDNFISRSSGYLHVQIPTDLDNDDTYDQLKEYFQQEGGYIRASSFERKFPGIELIDSSAIESYDFEYADSNIEVEIDEEVEEESEEENSKEYKSHLPEWL